MDTQATTIEGGAELLSSLALPECVVGAPKTAAEGPVLWSSAEEESEYERVSGDRLVRVMTEVLHLCPKYTLSYICGHM
jgi:hypothetical protein